MGSSRIQNPTAMGLFSVTFCFAARTITKSALIICDTRYDGLLTALRSFAKSAISRIFCLWRTCSMVLPKVALACSLTKSASKSDFAFYLCAVQKSIQGFSHAFWLNDIIRRILSFSARVWPKTESYGGDWHNSVRNQFLAGAHPDFDMLFAKELSLFEETLRCSGARE